MRVRRDSENRRRSAAIDSADGGESDDLTTTPDTTADVTVPGGVVSVSPDSAAQGDTNVLVTFTLNAGAQPPLPPDNALPDVLAESPLTFAFQGIGS